MDERDFSRSKFYLRIDIVKSFGQMLKSLVLEMCQNGLKS